MNDSVTPPPPPVPAQPAQARQLEYAYVMRRRPAIVTAVGVMSIVVGVATLGACVLGLIGAGAVYRLKVVLANAPPPGIVTTPATGPATAPTTLPATDVQAALAAVRQQAAASPLNASQEATLQALLEAPGQRLVLPTPSMPAARYVFSAEVDDAGAAHVIFMHDVVSISPQGHVIGVHATAAIPGTIVSSISGVAIGLAMAESILSGLLALFLIVTGILTLRQSLGARRLHWYYAGLKVPLSVAAVLIWAWLLHGLNRGFGSMPLLAATSTPATFFSVLIYVALVLGMAGLIYPIALIFALRGRQANAYYNMVT